MKKSTKIILLFFTLLLPVFIFMFITGIYQRLFINYGDFHSMIGRMNNQNPMAVMNQMQSNMYIMSVSMAFYYITYIVCMIVYGLDLIKRLKESAEKIIWFIIIIFTGGLGMLVYYFKYIWPDVSPQVEAASEIASVQN